MRCDRLNVFDFDGTLIRCNSFRVISARLVFLLAKKLKFKAFIELTYYYAIRKIGFYSHLEFKEKVVKIFEKNLSEPEKRQIVNDVFESNINTEVFEVMQRSDNCVITTASPYSFVSRICFGQGVVVISSLMPDESLPDRSNFGAGKMANLKSFFQDKGLRIAKFYTDSDEDRPVIEFSDEAFMCQNGKVFKAK